jgi:hypothetical protein
MTYRSIINLFVLSLLVLIPSCGSSSKPKDADLPKTPRRVLFIGDSFTSYNGGIPNALNRLSKGKLDCTACAEDGKTLAWHWSQGSARKTLGSERWDDVVLQDYILQPIQKPDIFDLFVRRFDAQAKGVGARTVLFMTWPRQDHSTDAAAIFHEYEDASATNHTALAPVGVAFLTSHKKRPDLNLYNEDKVHPSPTGTYLAACVFYKTLLHRTPVGLESFILDDKGAPLVTLPPADAQFLQELANQVVESETGPVDPEMERLLR